MTWAADGRQFVSWADGTGFFKHPKKVFHGHMFTVSGDPPDLTFEDVPGYPDDLIKIPDDVSGPASYWAQDCLALDGRVYQYLMTTSHPWLKQDGGFWPDFYANGVKLIYSPDNGRSWHNQDGSSPVVWEKWNERSRGNMAFFDEEPEGALTTLSFLQMGRNYELNRDGYIYVYSNNGDTDGRANELVIFRVLKSRILDRRSYEFFAGLRPDGSARWDRDVSARAVAHTFPRGWVSGKIPGEVPSGWRASVVYNAPLGVYIMVSSGPGITPEGGWNGKPSYLGFWVAQTPWGPFTQIHEELAWTPGNDKNARAGAPVIAPKWISADGKSFWLGWGDYQYSGGDNPDRALIGQLRDFVAQGKFAQGFVELLRKHLPYCLLSMQRVDIVLS